MADFGFLHDNSIDTVGLTLYLSDCLTKGIFSGVGKDIWERMKKKPSKKSEEGIIESFERNPQEQTSIDRLVFVLEGWVEDDHSFKDELVSLLKTHNPLDDRNTTYVSGSKNLVIGSNLNNNSGTIQIGDKN